MAKLTVFIDHDIVVRHFIHSRAMVQLEGEHDVLFVFPENHKRVRSDLRSLPVGRFTTVPVSADRTYQFRRLYHATVLRQMRRSEARHRQATFQFWRDALGAQAFRQSWLCSLPLVYPLYRRRVLSRLGINHDLMRLVQQERPDVIIHPTVLEGLFVSDLVELGRRQQIPTLYVMNSWDNPATKAMMVGYPTRLAVWGQQTKEHAIRYMGVPPERIVVTGAAQFDLFGRSPREAPEAYRRRLNVPDRARVLLYAGSSKGLNETRHLLALEAAIDRGELEDCFVLYRPHPWRGAPEGEEDFFGRSWRHVVMSPDMEASYRSSREAGGGAISLTDYEDTHVTLSAVDAVISPLSTILLEAALHGKPIAAYLPDEEVASNNFLRTTANMVHFTDFFEHVDCVKCERPQDLVADCGRLLQMAGQPGIGERLRRQCAYCVAPFDTPYGERLADLVRSLLG